MEKGQNKEKSLPQTVKLLGQNISKPEVTPERPTLSTSVPEEKKLDSIFLGRVQSYDTKMTADGNQELDFSSSKLYDLEILNDLPSRKLQVQEIFLNRNYLANIDALNQLTKLRKI